MAAETTEERMPLFLFMFHQKVMVCSLIQRDILQFMPEVGPEKIVKTHLSKKIVIPINHGVHAPIRMRWKLLFLLPALKYMYLQDRQYWMQCEDLICSTAVVPCHHAGVWVLRNAYDHYLPLMK